MKLRHPYLVRRGGHYYFEPRGKLLLANGGCSSVALGMNEAAAISAARELYERLKEAVVKGEVLTREDSTFTALAEAWLASLTLADNTISGRRSAMVFWSGVFGDSLLSAITPERIYSALTNSDYGQGSRANRRSALHAFMADQVRAGRLMRNPVAEVSMPTSRPRYTVFSDSDTKLLIATARGMGLYGIADAIRLGWSWGLRRCDLIALRWDNIQGERVVLTQQKTGAQVCLPVALGSEAAECLSEIRLREVVGQYIITRYSGQRYTATQFSYDWGKVRKAAGLADRWFADMRNTVANQLANDGCTRAEIAATLGHASEAMVARYTRLPVYIPNAACERKL